MSIELKRFHNARLKKKRRYYWGRDLLKEPDMLSRVAATPKSCSCWMCCNKRINEGNTLQEKKAFDIFNEAS